MDKKTHCIQKFVPNLSFKALTRVFICRQAFFIQIRIRFVCYTDCNIVSILNLIITLSVSFASLTYNVNKTGPRLDTSENPYLIVSDISDHDIFT